MPALFVRPASKFKPRPPNPKLQQVTAGMELSAPSETKLKPMITPALTSKILINGLPTYSPTPKPAGLLVTCTLAAAWFARLSCKPLMMPWTRLCAGSLLDGLLNENWNVSALAGYDQKFATSISVPTSAPTENFGVMERPLDTTPLGNNGATTGWVNCHIPSGEISTS